MIWVLCWFGSGVGGVVCDYEVSLFELGEKVGLFVIVMWQVLVIWIDYNGYMNEMYYLEVVLLVMDCFMEMVGVDVGYVVLGKSYFMVENYICYLDEIYVGDCLIVMMQVLGGQGKKMYLFYWLWCGDGMLVVMVEIMLLYIDLIVRCISLFDVVVVQVLLDWVVWYRDMFVEGVGCFVGQFVI